MKTIKLGTEQYRALRFIIAYLSEGNPIDSDIRDYLKTMALPLFPALD